MILQQHFAHATTALVFWNLQNIQLCSYDFVNSVNSDSGLVIYIAISKPSFVHVILFAMIYNAVYLLETTAWLALSVNCT